MEATYVSVVGAETGPVVVMYLGDEVAVLDAELPGPEPPVPVP